jgi:heat shock protein HtpX
LLGDAEGGRRAALQGFGVCDDFPMASKRSAFGRDRGLQGRMLLTMFLLGLLYVALIGALIASGAGGVTIAIVAVALFGFQLFASDKLALATMGARVVTPQEAPELHAIVERLCIQADLPKPRVAIMDANMPNAFATGRSQKSATICATSGLLRMLEPAELEGVIGHELTHVINRDVMVMTIASFFAMVSAVIIRFGFFFGMFGGGGFGGGRGGRGGQNEEEAVLVVILVSVVVYAVSFVLLRTLSRYREYAADRGSAILTGRPSALASALIKISGTIERIPSNDLRSAEGMSAFFIVPARAKNSLMNIFADHPPLEKRLAALQRLEAQLQGTAG